MFGISPSKLASSISATAGHFVSCCTWHAATTATTATTAPRPTVPTREHGAPAIAKAAFARWLASRKDSIDNAFHLHQAYSMTVRGLARLKELRRACALLPQLHAAREAKEDRGLFVDELVTWARLADPVMSLTRACEAVRGPYLDRVEFELSAFIRHCIKHPPRETRALAAALERFRTVNR